MLSYRPGFFNIYSNCNCLLYPIDIQLYPHLGSRKHPPRPLPTGFCDLCWLSLYLSLQFQGGTVPVIHVSNLNCLATPFFWKIVSIYVIHSIIFSIPLFYLYSNGSLKYLSLFWVRFALPLLYRVYQLFSLAIDIVSWQFLFLFVLV